MSLKTPYAFGAAADQLLLPNTTGVNDGAGSVVRKIREAMPMCDRGRPLCWTDRLSDLGLSSLRLVGLIVALEEEFRLSERELGCLRPHCTVGTLVQVCLYAQAAIDGTASTH